MGSIDDTVVPFQKHRSFEDARVDCDDLESMLKYGLMIRVGKIFNDACERMETGDRSAAVGWFESHLVDALTVHASAMASVDARQPDDEGTA
jgi:hypothetical protein